MSNMTLIRKPAEAKHDWFVVDADGMVLGRLASRVAFMLKGKDRVDYTPHVDSGAGVVVINCDKIRVTGGKEKKKIYTTFSGYPGGLKKFSYEKLFAKDPTLVLRRAVTGMLPKNRQTAHILKRLKLYKGSSHPHAAQKPAEKKL